MPTYPVTSGSGAKGGWRGRFELTEDGRQDVSIDAFGVASATEFYWGPFDRAVGFVMGRSQHPTYPWLRRKRASINRSERNYADIQITYEGIPPATHEATYRLTGSTGSEPIETHPDFVTDLAGTKAAPKTANKPTFDDKGKFTGWESDSPLAGVKSYLSPSMTYEETLVMGVIRSNQFNGLGDKGAPPASAVLPAVGGRDWLLIGGDATPIGTGGKVTRRWKLSGKDGWNPLIY